MFQGNISDFLASRYRESSVIIVENSGKTPCLQDLHNLRSLLDGHKFSIHPNEGSITYYSANDIITNYSPMSIGLYQLNDISIRLQREVNPSRKDFDLFIDITLPHKDYPSHAGESLNLQLIKDRIKISHFSYDGTPSEGELITPCTLLFENISPTISHFFHIEVSTTLDTNFKY